MLQTTNASRPERTMLADLFGFVPDEKPPSKADPPAPTAAVMKPEKATPQASQKPKSQATAGDDEEDDHELAMPNLDEDSSDTPETFIAKRMWRLMMADLAGLTEGEPDLFGQHCGDRERRKQDALIWIFNLNPDGADLAFEWVCNEIGIDHEVVRRMVARYMRADLKRILRLLACMVSLDHAMKCEIDLLDYVNLSGW